MFDGFYDGGVGARRRIDVRAKPPRHAGDGRVAQNERVAISTLLPRANTLSLAAGGRGKARGALCGAAALHEGEGGADGNPALFRRFNQSWANTSASLKARDAEVSSAKAADRKGNSWSATQAVNDGAESAAAPSACLTWL